MDALTHPAEGPLVHVVDDDAAVRDSLGFLLDAAGHGVRLYGSAAAFLTVAPSLMGGCVLTDVRMPDMDGLTLQRRLVAMGCRLPVIVMTGHGDVPVAVEALKNGATDFLEKPFDDERLLVVVRSALAASAQVEIEIKMKSGIIERLNSLTPRERDVLDGLAAGHPTKAIARNLGTSPRTVEVQRARVMEKMAAGSVADLVRMVIGAGSDGTSAES